MKMVSGKIFHRMNLSVEVQSKPDNWKIKMRVYSPE